MFKRKRTVSFVKLWNDIIVANLLKNNSTRSLTRHAPYYMDLTGIYSGEDNVTYLYSIDGYPRELEISFRTSIRRACEEGVCISFISTFEKYEIPWKSTQMRSKLRVWKMIEGDTEEGEIDAYNLNSLLNEIDTQQWRRDSLTYLNEAKLRRGRKTFKFRSLMLVSGKRGDAFDGTIKEVVSFCRDVDIKLSRITGDILDYIEVFSPFSLGYNNRVIKQCGCNVIPDELLARLNTYSQGKIGTDGIVWGTDVYSSFPCLKVVKRTPDAAEVWLLTSETGGGKSYFGKGLLIQLLAFSEFNCTINDVEGFEYLPIADFMSEHDLVVILNMSEGSGSYFDPVEIIRTGDRSLDADMFSLSTSFTISFFKTIVGHESDSDKWVDIVINDAVAITYANMGVTEDMETWSNSKGLTLYSVYSTLKSLLVTGVTDRAVSTMFSRSLYTKGAREDLLSVENDVNRLITSNEDYQKATEFAIAKASRYFEPNGTRSHLFKSRVTVDAIKDAKLVICSFGMAGKSPQTVDPVQMALMQLCAANISHLRSIFSKMNGKYNIKVWEEFQRWGNFPDADKIISTALTGGRKLGDVNIVLTNNVGSILENDKFSIFTNITSIAVGCIWDAKVREDLCLRLSIPQMIPELEILVSKNKDLISYSKGDTLMYSPYKNAFLIGLDNTVFTITRMSLPHELSESSMFNTGIELRLEEDGEG